MSQLNGTRTNGTNGVNGHQNTSPSVSTKNWGGYDHLKFYVSNSKQAADWYCIRFGFQYCGYSGLETGSRDYSQHVIRQNDIYLCFISSLNPVETELGKRIAIKGDAVKDVAFKVRDCHDIYTKAIQRGAVSVSEPETLKDEHGTVIVATIKTYGDVVHTFVQRVNYTGCFLPGFKAVTKTDPLNAMLPSPNLLFIDHIVGNQPDLQMESACDWYEKILNFHRFWSVDDSQIHTEYSSLRSIVMSDPDSDAIKMPINEPADGKRKSQIQEYIDYNGEAGVQHVALRTHNIIESIQILRSRGLEFLSVPKSYYDDLRIRLKQSAVVVKEDIDVLEKLCILVDFDDQGYLLQLFTKPTQDRPTLFYEVIQRANFSGFGVGNFKALFEAIERDQVERGN